MNILHVINDDKFTNGLIVFFKNNFRDYDQKFIVYGENKISPSTIKDGVTYLAHWKYVDNKIKQMMNKADLIIFNGLFGSEKIFLKSNINYLKKSYFCLWGGDFYCLKKDPISFREWGKNTFLKYCLSNVSGVINLIPKDFEELKKLVNFNGKHFIATVCDNGEDLEILENVRAVDRNERIVRIIVGNSSTETNCHMQAFDYLKKYRNEDIEVYCPLSYGDFSYREKVISYGKEIFGDKFIPLTDYMTPDEYFNILSKVRIGIFNNNRQQAMGNIGALLFLGAKIFIRDDTAMWERFNEELNYHVFNIKDINNIDFNSFISFDEEQKETNYKVYKKYHEKEYYIEQWSKVFDSVK